MKHCVYSRRSSNIADILQQRTAWYNRPHNVFLKPLRSINYAGRINYARRRHGTCAATPPLSKPMGLWALQAGLTALTSSSIILATNSEALTGSFVLLLLLLPFLVWASPHHDQLLAHTRFLPAASAFALTLAILQLSPAGRHRNSAPLQVRAFYVLTTAICTMVSAVSPAVTLMSAVMMCVPQLLRRTFGQLLGKKEAATLRIGGGPVVLFLVVLFPLQQPNLLATGTAVCMAVATLLAPSSSARWPPETAAEWHDFWQRVISYSSTSAQQQLQLQQHRQQEINKKEVSKKSHPYSKCSLHAVFMLLGCMFMTGALVQLLYA